MFNVSGPELLVIMLVALIVLGPDKLPSAARKIGNVMSELRRMSTGFQAELRDALREPPPPPATPSTTDSTPTAVQPEPTGTSAPDLDERPERSEPADPSQPSEPGSRPEERAIGGE